MNDKRVVIDTNLLLDDPSIITRYNCVILSHVIRELEKHKLKGGELAYNARRATRIIEENLDRVHFDAKDYKPRFDDNADDYYEDNKILQACIDNGYSIASKDMLLKHKAKLYEVSVVDFLIEDENEYTGYKEVEILDEELAHIYENRHVNTYNLLTNEYLIATHPFGHSEVVFKWNGNMYVDVEERSFHSDMLGKFKPMDSYQKAAMDSVVNHDITMIRGGAGSGKTAIALNYAISQQSKGKCGKITMATGLIPVAGVKTTGFLPGDLNEKIGFSGLGNILSSKLGSRDEIFAMIQTGRLEFIPISDIRGYETGEDSIFILTEFQNTNVDIAKLVLQRVAEGTKVIIDGDDNTQVDNQMFAGSNNGMKSISRAFRGEDIYGEIQLKHVRRSRIASIAEKMK